MVLLIVRRQLARPRIASATTPESRMFAGDLTILWVPLLLCLQAPMTPRPPAAPLSTGFISGEPSAACPRSFSVEKWTTIDPGRESVGRALCFTLDFGVIVHDNRLEVSRFSSRVKSRAATQSAVRWSRGILG